MAFDIFWACWEGGLKGIAAGGTIVFGYLLVVLRVATDMLCSHASSDVVAKEFGLLFRLCMRLFLT